MEQEIQNLQYQVQLMNNNLEKLTNQLIVQESNSTMMIQSINMQIQIINQMNQTLSVFSNRLSDMEISFNNNDDVIKDVVDAQNNLSIEIQELKNAIEGLRFFAINQNEY